MEDLKSYAEQLVEEKGWEGSMATIIINNAKTTDDIDYNVELIENCINETVKKEVALISGGYYE